MEENTTMTTPNMENEDYTMPMEYEPTESGGGSGLLMVAGVFLAGAATAAIVSWGRKKYKEHKENQEILKNYRRERAEDEFDEEPEVVDVEEVKKETK